jgi:hypothetical protein
VLNRHYTNTTTSRGRPSCRRARIAGPRSKSCFEAKLSTRPLSGSVGVPRIERRYVNDFDDHKGSRSSNAKLVQDTLPFQWPLLTMVVRVAINKNPRSELRGIGGRKEADQKSAASCGEYVPKEIQPRLQRCICMV